MTSAVRKFSSRIGRSKSKNLINVILVRKSHFQEAVEFMKNHYLDDPFIQAMGISVRHQETQNFLSNLWLALLKSGLSLAAIQREKICGLCINALQTQVHTNSIHANQNTNNPNNTTVFQELAKYAKSSGTRNLLYAWDKIDREVLIPMEATDNKIKILELAACAVGHNHRRLGIAKKIIQSSADMAMLMGFDGVRIDCTHVATAKICNEFGWKKIWEMPFDKFEGVVLSNNLGEKTNENENESEKLKVRVFVKMFPSNLKSLDDVKK